MGITATPEEAEELRKVVVSGVQSVESDGRKVVYRSLDDQMRTLGEVSPGNERRRRLAEFSKGFK